MWESREKGWKSESLEKGSKINEQGFQLPPVLKYSFIRNVRDYAVRKM